MRAAVDISMYPLTGDYRPPIQAFIDRLNTHPGLNRENQCFGDSDLGSARSSDAHPDRRDGSLGQGCTPVDLRHKGASGT